MMKKALIIDDELSDPGQSQTFEQSYAVSGFQYLFAEDEEYAIRAISKEKDISIILLDIRFEDKADKDKHGLKVLEMLAEEHPQIPIIMMSNLTDPEVLIHSWDLGARSYIVKWGPNNPRFHRELKEKLERFSLYQSQEIIIGSSPKIEKLKQTVHLLAQYDTSVLIEGEKGSGKEVVAQALHQLGSRAERPKVDINCAAIPKELMESELFGYGKGAFTGANTMKKGRIEVADGGTIFLDEIGEMPLELQPKLLRFLEDKEYTRVGEVELRTADVRIISATNKNLMKAVEMGEFRGDLYDRLNVFKIETPPLRECRQDIPVLANHFLELFKNEKPKTVTTFSPEVIDLLQVYDWPGNARELRNVVERMFILTPSGEIQKDTLPRHIIESNSVPLILASGEIPEKLDLNSYTDQISWSILKAIYLDELKNGVYGIGKRVAERTGLHPVAGFGRKIKQLCRSSPCLITEIEKTLKDFLDQTAKKEISD